MSTIKLQSSDGVTFSVDPDTVKQMVTIQTMIDQEKEESAEIRTVPAVKAWILTKIIQWTKYHKIFHRKKSKSTWCRNFFNVNKTGPRVEAGADLDDLKNMFEIIIAADYLKVESLLEESFQHVLVKYEWRSIEDAAKDNKYATVVPLLQNHKRKHGDVKIVTIQDGKHLKYFDTKVKSKIKI